MKTIGNKIEKWRHTLEHRMEENLLLKEQLADILKHDYDHSLLEEIETLQTRLIFEDELIAALRQVINELETLLIINNGSDENLSQMVPLKIAWLQKDMAYSDVRFWELKSVFNEFRKKIYAGSKGQIL